MTCLRYNIFVLILKLLIICTQIGQSSSLSISQCNVCKLGIQPNALLTGGILFAVLKLAGQIYALIILLFQVRIHSYSELWTLYQLCTNCTSDLRHQAQGTSARNTSVNNIFKWLHYLLLRCFIFYLDMWIYVYRYMYITYRLYICKIIFSNHVGDNSECFMYNVEKNQICIYIYIHAHGEGKWKRVEGERDNEFPSSVH